ncbi:MAG: DUF948 domain-containing protein [Gemmatimonas sp.]|nr:DUF948 domain-containing protein [Gemmatimonadaceae bacterium]
MTSLLAFAGPAVLQSAAAVRDTVIMKQVGGRGLLDTIAAIASIAMLVSVMLVALVVARLLWSYRTTYKKVNSLLDRLHGDLAPLVRNANAIADNVNFVTTSIRTDVQKVSDTIDTANDRVQQALSLAEHRLNEFNALLSVVQDEAEGVFLSTASTVRGVRRGAATFRSRGGTDLASEELDAADPADDVELDEDDLEIQEEDDGDDRNPESAAEALPTAPRVRPRARSRRRA